MHQIRTLEQKRTILESSQARALARRETLSARLRYQDEPAAIELALMDRLGLVPEGWTKVYFTSTGDPLATPP